MNAGDCFRDGLRHRPSTDAAGNPAHLQSSFLQQQVAAASAQTKELFELSANVTQQAFAAFNAASVKTFEQLTKMA